MNEQIELGMVESFYFEIIFSPVYSTFTRGRHTMIVKMGDKLLLLEQIQCMFISNIDSRASL